MSQVDHIRGDLGSHTLNRWELVKDAHENRGPHPRAHIPRGEGAVSSLLGSGPSCLAVGVPCREVSQFQGTAFNPSATSLVTMGLCQVTRICNVRTSDSAVG